MYSTLSPTCRIYAYTSNTNTRIYVFSPALWAPHPTGSTLFPTLRPAGLGRPGGRAAGRPRFGDACLFFLPALRWLARGACALPSRASLVRERIYAY